MFTKQFWKGAAERAVSTFAQSLAGALAGFSLVFGADDWLTVRAALASAGIAAVTSVLKSLATPGITAAGAPGAQEETELAEAQAIAAANSAAASEDVEAHEAESVDELPAYDGSDPDAEYSGHAVQDEPGRHEA